MHVLDLIRWPVSYVFETDGPIYSLPMETRDLSSVTTGSVARLVFFYSLFFSPTWQFFLQFSFLMHQTKREKYLNNTTRWKLFSSTYHILNFNLFVKTFIWGFQFHVWCWFWCLAQFRTTLLLLNNFKKNIKIVFSEFKSGSIQARAALFAKSTGCDVSKRKKELQLD